MFKVTRNEANRTIILLALVLVPIVVLFTILATALACSEYWSLYRERQRLLRSGESGHTTRTRSDVPCLSSSSESSKASTKRSESSDGDANMYMKPGLYERSPSGINHTVRRIPSKGGIFALVAEAIDFNKQRYSSPAPVNRGFSVGHTRPIYREPNSANDHPYLPNHIIRERISTNLIASRVQSRRRTPPLARTNLCVPKNHNYVHTRFPCHVPITSAKLDITMDAMKISAHEDLVTWAAVEISATVSNLDSDLKTQIGCEVPLDIMIHVDNSEHVASFIKRACNTVLPLVSAMDILVDRLAIGCISADPEQNLQLLLPLSTCNLEILDGLLRSIQTIRLEALHEASNLPLRHSSSGALRHMFVITANSGISLSEMTANITNRVRFHTISPEPILGTWAFKPMDGGHPFAYFDDEEDKESVQAIKNNLKKIIRHLRYGLHPGALPNLSIGLNGQNGYDIEAVLGETKRKTMRPGDKWTLLVKIKAISEARKVFFVGDSFTKNQVGSDVDRTINRHPRLLGSCDRALAENIFTVSLEYSHSTLSDSAAIKLENECEITRFL
ncbi:hypothetical protein ACJ72_03532 [Emergomyces africanus]|uniref:Uncharacterized protein n=1 Tax=Emergomyces africanus TaxID=1955775 RepID=A0A1B7NZA1_9EURO|nr:hypothetical protein ACJ72_03532 [Emergomyces africanus]